MKDEFALARYLLVSSKLNMSTVVDRCNKVNRLLRTIILILLALPVMAQECELYVTVLERCHPGSVLQNAVIKASNRAGQLIVSDMTNIQGSRRIVLPSNDEYTIQVAVDGYSPETLRIRNLCMKSSPHLIFYLFLAGVQSC